MQQSVDSVHNFASNLKLVAFKNCCKYKYSVRIVSRYTGSNYLRFKFCSGALVVKVRLYEVRRLLEPEATVSPVLLTT